MNRRSLISIARNAMACEFSVLFPNGEPRGCPAGYAALDEIDRVEEKLSVYREDSDVSRLNGSAGNGPAAVDEELFRLIELAARLHTGTGGAFDCAMGALIRAWGFYQGPRRVPPAGELEPARARSGMQHLCLDGAARTVAFSRPGVELNFGAIGKGYALDRAREIIAGQFGGRSALLQGGQSSFVALGAPPGEPDGWPVAVADPFQQGRTVATLRLRDRALGTSGAAHQFFMDRGRRYGHVLDPRTGWPADRLASATVLAPSAAEADALSTAFFVAGVEAARDYCRRHPQIAALLVTRPEAAQPPRIRMFNLNRKEWKAA